MTETKDTTQTMRDHLRQHGLPVAWAEWVREIAIAPPGEPRSYEVDFLFAPTAPTRRVFPMGDARTDHPAGFYDRTDDEMIEAWAEYATKREEWRAKYGDVATICKPAPASSHYTVRVEGNGNVVLLSGSSDAGPWRVESVTVPTANYRVHAVGIGVGPGEWIGREPGAVYSWDETAKNPKLSADDITAALWDMPGKERAVVLYPFWPAISEAAQRTLLAEERATAAMADAAHYRCLLNDCRRVLTTAEDDRDAARKERDDARASLDLERATSARLWKRINLDPDGLGLELPAGFKWKTDHHGGWEIHDRAGKEIGCVIHRAADCYTWHGEGSDHGQAPGVLPACLALAASLRAVFWGWGESHEPPERAGRVK